MKVPVYPFALPEVSVNPEPMISTKAQVERLVNDLELGSEVSNLFGLLTKTEIATTQRNADGLSGGWIVKLTFKKPVYRDEDLVVFPYNVCAFIPYLARPGRAVRKIYLALRNFLEHELDEGFRVGGVQIYDPHRADEALATYGR